MEFSYILNTARVFTHSTQHPTQRSGGIHVDPDTLRQSLELCHKGIDFAMQSPVEVQETFMKAAKEACLKQLDAPSSHKKMVETLYRDADFRQWTLGIVAMLAGVIALNKNALDLWKLFVERNKVAQQKIQGNLNISDLEMLEKINEFCETMKPLAWKKEGNRHMVIQEMFKTLIQAQLASGENRRGSSIAKTAYANVTGLEIKSADAPAVYTTRQLQTLIQGIEQSRVKKDALGKETKTKEVIIEHLKKLEENNLALRSTRLSRSALTSLAKYRNKEEKAPTVKRAQLEGLRAVGSRLVDSNWNGAVLYKAKLHGAYLELMDLAMADLRLIKAPGATFKKCTLTDADAKGLKANGSHWGGVNGDYADFSFAYSTGEDPASKLYKTPDFKRATFYRVVTDPITFTLTPVSNSFDGADFRGAQFQHAQLLDFTARWANFSAPEWKPATLKQGTLPPYMVPEHPEWAAYHKPPVDFSHARMAMVNLEGSDLTGAQFRDVKTEAKRETVPVIKPMEEPVNPEQNEITAKMAPWINRYDEACPPVNVVNSILKKTAWDDTVLNRVKYNSEGVLEPSFKFKGAFVDDADFRNARLQVEGTNAVISVENAVRQVVQGEGIILKKQLETLFDGMRYEHTKPRFHSDETVNLEFTGNIMDLKQGKVGKND